MTRGRDTNDPLRFHSFFLLSPKREVLLDEWKLIEIDKFYLYYHPSLEITTSVGERAEILLAGHIIDSERPELSDTDVVVQIASECNTFEDLERRLAALSGHWIVFANIGGNFRIYPDACGFMSVFFTQDDAGQLWAASQPSLLEYLGLTAKRNEMAVEYAKMRHTGSWPINVLPYEAVRQLVPNHYLDVRTRKTVRFWPANDIEPQEVTPAADKMLVILRGTIEAYVNRGQCALALTGGYDSRALLAAAMPYRNDMHFFTILRENTCRYDRAIPRAISKAISLNWKQYAVTTSEPEPADVQVLRDNVGGMFLDPCMKGFRAIAESVEGFTAIQGLAGEILRCFYYPDGEDPGYLSAEMLTELVGFGGNSYAKVGFAKWLEDAPSIPNLNILDLFYWEHRDGVWTSSGLACREPLMKIRSPFNNRKLLEIGLGVPVRQRAKTYQLFREIARLGDPRLVQYDYNTDFLSRVALKAHVPWRIRYKLGWL